MQGLNPVKESELNREHVIQGTWSTRKLCIDGQEITMEMVKGRMRGDGWYPDGGFVDVRTFAWGETATPRELRVLAYGCCEFAAPTRWTQHITSRFAIEQFFTTHLQRLSSADFTLRYCDRELRSTMRRLKRGRGVPYWWARKL
jgi:hypothetical protein